jgi:transposase-like protein
MSNAFAAPHFHNEAAARALIESVRWPNGPICPHCGTIGSAYATKRTGLYRCSEADCRKDFTVTTRTVMERSKIPLTKWMMGFYMMSASKKGVSAHQMHRALGVTYQSAWFMCHRIREAMSGGGFAGPIGGEGKVVEADETYFGPVDEPRPRNKYKPPYTKKGRSGPSQKRAIVALVERGGSLRSFHVTSATKETVSKIIKENVAQETRFFTDESRLYGEATAHFAEHSTVRHSTGEYVRGDVHTNTIEGAFSIFKRGMKGVYQHCAEKHLHRYLSEFDFRYSNRIALGVNDGERADLAIKNAAGKRLTYRLPH